MDILKGVLSKKSGFGFLSGKNGKTLTALDLTATKANLQKIDNVFKLIYKLFLYSVVGLFAKIVIKLFKFF